MRPARAARRSTPAMEADGPTPQTRARLRPDPLLRLQRLGRLEQRHLAAAEDIRRVFEALTLRLGARALDLSLLPAPKRRRGRFLQPFERMREDLYQRYRQVFLPWAKTLRRRRVAGAPCPLAQVLEIVIEGRPLGEAAARHQRRRKDALDQLVSELKDALTAYADRAGYRRPPRYRATDSESISELGSVSAAGARRSAGPCDLLAAATVERRRAASAS